MIDGCFWTKESLGFIYVRDWYLRDVLPLGKIKDFPDSRSTGTIHSSTATISERSLPHALGLEVLEMVVKHVDRPIKGFDDKSTLQPPEADWTPRRKVTTLRRRKGYSRTEAG